ncbi:hypothetical protein NDU88_008068 [Pleurodeles waltl]|uniref:Uncharacterized protein n=1 Tax=Pleurodeles waltl TaxID=8319 RepID=A0AAV7RWK6_PLEWA|nr:hypothetical protein NDU88_008068 [Pleurodeles waltl]
MSQDGIQDGNLQQRAVSRVDAKLERREYRVADEASCLNASREVQDEEVNVLKREGGGLIWPGRDNKES